MIIDNEHLQAQIDYLDVLAERVVSSCGHTYDADRALHWCVACPETGLRCRYCEDAHIADDCTVTQYPRCTFCGRCDGDKPGDVKTWRVEFDRGYETLLVTYEPTEGLDLGGAHFVLHDLVPTIGGIRACQSCADAAEIEAQSID